MNIQVRPVVESSQHYTFNVTLSKAATVAVLKKEICLRWNVHPNQQRVEYQGTGLELDARQLTSYNLTSNSTVCVSVIPATIRIFLRPLDPRAQRKRITAELTWNANQLKREAAKVMKELGHGQVKLCLGEREIEGDMPLSAIEGLVDECELLFKVRETGGIKANLS